MIAAKKLFPRTIFPPKHLFHDIAHELTHLDSKIFRTLRALVSKPGLLTQEYWAGRLGRWIRPLRLYIFLSALQYVFSAGTLGPMGVHFSITSNARGEPDLKIGSMYARFHTSEEFHDVEHKIYVGYGAFRWIGLFGFAGLSWLLYWNRQPYYGAHMIAGLHFYSSQYLLSAVLTQVSRLAGPNWVVNGSLLGTLYLFFALRRLFGESFWKTFGKAILMFFGAFLCEVLTIAAIGGIVLLFLRR